MKLKKVADGAKDIQDGAEKYAQIVSNRMTAAARFAAEREGKAERQEKENKKKRIRSNKLSLMQRQKRTEKKQKRRQENKERVI